MSKLEKPSGEEEGRTESGGSQETTGLVWSPQLGWSLHRPEPSRETSTSTFPALFQATFNWDPSTTTPPTDNGLFKPTQIDVCHVGESYDAESCREHFKILIQFNYFCKVQKCIHPNPSQPQQIRLQLLLKHTTLNVKVQFFRRIDKLKHKSKLLLFVWRGSHICMIAWMSLEVICMTTVTWPQLQMLHGQSLFCAES